MARLFALVLAFVAYASAFSGPASVGAVSRASVAMSTKFTDPYVQKMKKKNPKTGSTTNLKGVEYTTTGYIVFNHASGG